MRPHSARRLRRATAVVVLLTGLVAGPAAVGGAAPKYGVVTGSIRTFGGVAESSRAGSPTSGRVVFQLEHGQALTVGVGKSGQFTVKLKPGVYTAFGGPPGWFPTCRGNDDKPFRVRADHSYKIVVACVAL